MRRIGLYVIGDEILSGRRADRHLTHVISLLRARGLSLAWAQFLPDERDVLVNALRISMSSDNVVFSCGGIGATPDDHTRQAAAAAAGLPVELHSEAREAIARAVAKRGLHDLSTPEGRQVLRMGEFPSGARIVPNPFNGIPGFALGSHYFLPGFPVMAWPMIEWVLDIELAGVLKAQSVLERSLIVYGKPESSITPLMQEVESRYAGVRTFSLPSVGDGADGRSQRRHIELGVKGPPESAAGAFEHMIAQLRSIGAEIELLHAPEGGLGQQ